MVSLGPGDIDLITLKALKALKESDAICIPTKSEDHSFEKSMTHKIVTKLMKEHNFSRPIIPVYTPMHFRKEDWQYQVDVLYKSFETYKSLSFVTLGDSAVYSTVYYLLDIIEVQRPKLYCNAEVIAGVTSFSQASAKVKKPLCVGDSRFEIVPLLDKKVPTTTVYMRPKIGMNTDAIEEVGSLYTFENMNYKEEHIAPYKKSHVDKYMTLFIDFFK
ncbi:MAG TPA: cobalt-precorrin-2 C(20)-methyltransferase [Campylobacterales bacterium]|nr:cobalt-precorrin-2 C(20)-methyltransferase [Campylobacterales bacterium]HIP42141.1 cobalt-precorrin-2 C(20)-methyltransferase [Campylobacterales bacterium]